MQIDPHRREALARVVEKYQLDVNLYSYRRAVTTRHPPFAAELRPLPEGVAFELRGSRVMVASASIGVCSLVLAVAAVVGRSPWYTLSAGLVMIAVVLGVVSWAHARQRVRIVFSGGVCRFTRFLWKFRVQEYSRDDVRIEINSVRLNRLYAPRPDWAGFGVVVWLTNDLCFAVALSKSYDDVYTYAEHVAALLPDITSLDIENNRKIYGRW